VAHGSRKKPLDFGGNPDHVTLGLGYRVRVTFSWRGQSHTNNKYILTGVCLMVAVLQDQRPCRCMRSTECSSNSHADVVSYGHSPSTRYIDYEIPEADYR